MKKLFGLLLGVGACALLVSCVPSEESEGDRAYDMAKKASGDARRTQLKKAYLNYDKAIKNNPDRVTNRLRERFLDMAITRVQMVLDEGSAHMDAIPLLINDIDKQLWADSNTVRAEVPSDLRQRYAAFLVQLGDSSAAKPRFTDALAYYDKAIKNAADPAPFRDKRKNVIKSVAEENYELGMMEWEMGQKDKEEAAFKFIRAEYFAKMALHFDSTYEKAKKLLSDCYKVNRETYSAYLTAVDDYADTLLFKKINRIKILMAIPDFKGGTAIVHMYNYSHNHLFMKSEDFTLVDANGKEYKAASMKMDPDILEYEKEAKYTLRFPAPSAPVKKLVYKNNKDPLLFSEKFFY